MTMSIQERFDAKYIPEPNTGCWLWDGCIDHKGYGTIWATGRTHKAHRFSYEMNHGPIPARGVVRHKCDVPGCVNPAHLVLVMPSHEPSDHDRERLMARSSPDPGTGCWLWRGHIGVSGYGLFSYGGRRQHAHRAAHELFTGPIPAGLVVDHLCRNRACVNPTHLEAVTNQENVRRGDKCLKGAPCAQCGSMPHYRLIRTRNVIRRECRTCKNAMRRKVKPDARI